VIDHLLSAPGLYGNAWLEPLNVLADAAALTSRVKLATGILVLPVRHPVVLAKEISTLCRLSGNRYRERTRRRARANTARSIGRVSRLVKVFCWLG